MVVKAGLPVLNGLSIIRAQASSKTLQKIIDQLIEDVENGTFLADSLDRFARIFGEFFINIVRVGEASGTLAQNLLYLSDELKKSKRLQNQIRSAMVYPAVILIATVSLVSFLAFFIFPKLLTVFSGLHVQLPLTTRMVIGAVKFLREDGVWALLALIAAVAVFKMLMRFVYLFRYAMHRLLLVIPVVGGLAIALNTANFSRILGLLLKSGVKIVEAITITASTFENEVYRKTIGAATEEIRRGGELADYLDVHAALFPGLLAGMVRVGDTTGNLEGNLEYLSDYYNEEIETKLQTLTSLLEPLLLLFMGGLVGLVAISIILPIYQLSSSVH
jgi:type IV pilus assembly protein PilC